VTNNRRNKQEWFDAH